MSPGEKLLFVSFPASFFSFSISDLLEWISFSCISYHNFKFQYRTLLISALYCAWVPKNWSFQTVVLEKTLESPLDSKIKTVNQGNQSWIFVERTVAKAEVLILWPPDAKRWLTGEDPDAGKDWGQEEGAIENEMVGWHHWLDRHEFEQTLGDSERQGSLACCSSWGHKELSMTEDWTTLVHEALNWFSKVVKYSKCYAFF